MNLIRTIYLLQCVDNFQAFNSLEHYENGKQLRETKRYVEILF